MKSIQNIFSTYLIVMILFSCNKDDSSNSQQDQENPIGEVLLVGANKSNITPATGAVMKMSGFSGRTEYFDGIHDDLFARTIVITDQDDNTTAIHCSIDQLNLGGNHFREIHNRVVTEIEGLKSLPLSNLFISATHTHGGPATGNTDNTEFRNEKIFQSIKAAYQNRQEAMMRVGKTTADNINVNRQNPHFGPMGNFVCSLEETPSGNSDKESHFVEFVSPQGESIASMITFGVHSTVVGQTNLQITGDLAGYASRYIEANTNPEHVSLFLYTGGGDQSPATRTQHASKIDNPVTGVKAFGDRLGSQVLPHFEEGEYLEDINIIGKAVPVELQRDYSDQDDDPDEPETRVIYGIKYSANFVIVSTPFELFSSTVQELKQNSQFKYPVILSLTNGVAHYIPPESTYNRDLNSNRANPEEALYVLDQCYENRTSIFTSTAEGTFKARCSELLTELHN